MGLMDYLRTFTNRNPASSSSGSGGSGSSSGRKKGENEVRLLFLGLDNAGKTSIFKRLCDEDLTLVKPTQGFQIKQLNQEGLQLMIWDVGGQKSLRPYWKNYFEAVDAVIYVIDSADRRRMEETGVELQLLLDNDTLQGVPFLVYANKQDLLNALSPQEISQGLNLYSIRDRAWQIFPCSARNATGIKDGMDFIMNEIRDNRAKKNLGMI